MEKNLQSKEALEKYRKLVNDINVCMFITNCTSGGNSPEHTRPMATIEVEDDGTLWFFSDIRSIKIEEVSVEHKVHLTYAHPGKESYMDVRGTADVITDRAQIKSKWKPMVKAWFPGGSDDPNLALLRVRPSDCYYWDAETGKMVAFLKIAAAAITGKRLAEGAEGSLKL
ncbi:pyridoxamine 5'-phosphate oxidase family protein [Paraflavisolibacter sp. H34]|uniref:pyridoxamine 5'-phosphate oxidase family protein n=1 Tax=Huijunlia imazamoxiresistens TaxID=3127457 RepID=UPI00301801FC